MISGLDTIKQFIFNHLLEAIKKLSIRINKKKVYQCVLKRNKNVELVVNQIQNHIL